MTSIEQIWNEIRKRGFHVFRRHLFISTFSAAVILYFSAISFVCQYYTSNSPHIIVC